MRYLIVKNANFARKIVLVLIKKLKFLTTYVLLLIIINERHQTHSLNILLQKPNMEKITLFLLHETFHYKIMVKSNETGRRGREGGGTKSHSPKNKQPFFCLEELQPGPPVPPSRWHHIHQVLTRVHHVHYLFVGIIAVATHLLSCAGGV